MINGKMVNSLTKHYLIVPVFYIPPKIYKGLQNPPGDARVASTDSILSNLVIYVDKILYPFIRHSHALLLSNIVT